MLKLLRRKSQVFRNIFKQKSTYEDDDTHSNYPQPDPITAAHRWKPQYDAIIEEPVTGYAHQARYDTNISNAQSASIGGDEPPPHQSRSLRRRPVAATPVFAASIVPSPTTVPDFTTPLLPESLKAPEVAYIPDHNGVSVATPVDFVVRSHEQPRQVTSSDLAQRQLQEDEDLALALQLFEEDVTLAAEQDVAMQVEEQMIVDLVARKSCNPVTVPVAPLTTGDALFGSVSNAIPPCAQGKVAAIERPQWGNAKTAASTSKAPLEGPEHAVISCSKCHPWHCMYTGECDFAVATSTLKPSFHTEYAVSGSSKAQPSANWERYDPLAWELAHTITRRQLNTSCPTKECMICVDTKDITHFPHQAITDLCDHAPSTCQECIATYIRSELEGKLFHEKVIRCPECSQPLSRDDVQQYADPTTFSTYASKATEDTVDKLPNFFRCPGPGCTSGQFHESGEDSPIVRCVACQNRFCYKHKVLWHETLSCDEYDAFVADPVNFKSQFERENERVEREHAEQAESRALQEDADREYAQGLLDEEEREEARRRAELERRERERREREERQRLEEQRRVAREAREKMQQELQRKQREEKASLATIGRTTKNCPGCAWPIEKNDGCSHMTCSHCLFEFCWECLAPQEEIMKYDNSKHKRSCVWHPDNAKEDGSSGVVVKGRRRV